MQWRVLWPTEDNGFTLLRRLGEKTVDLGLYSTRVAYFPSPADNAGAQCSMA